MYEVLAGYCACPKWLLYSPTCILYITVLIWAHSIPLPSDTMATVRSRVPGRPDETTLNLPRSPRLRLRNDHTKGEDARGAGDGLRPRFEGLAWSLAQMAPLHVRPSMLPPPLATRSDSFARSQLDARDARPAGPAHVCEQEDGQTKIMSHCELTGSHSSPRSQGARASDQRAQSRIAHEAGALGSRLTSRQHTC